MGSKCSAAMLEFINGLRREAVDEQAASTKYTGMAAKLAHFKAAGEPIYPSILDFDKDIIKKIAVDEISHAALLGAMADFLAQDCNVGEET